MRRKKNTEISGLPLTEEDACREQRRQFLVIKTTLSSELYTHSGGNLKLKIKACAVDM